jgi:hypothetical protein
MRAGATTSASIIKVLSNGVTVTLTGANQNGFRGIKHNGQLGWAHADYLATSSGFYLAMLVGQVGVYLLALAAESLRPESLPGRIASLARTFLLQNAGVLLGWANFLTGRRYTTWSSAARGKTSG